MLAMSLALVMTLTMVLSTVVFAETETVPYTYTTNAVKFSASTDTIYFKSSESTETYYSTNSTQFAFYLKSQARTFLAPYLYASGGIFMKLPFTSIAGLSGVDVNTISKVTLSLPLNFAASGAPTNNATWLALMEVTESDLAKAKELGHKANAGYFVEDTETGGYKPADYAPANVVNYTLDTINKYTWEKGDSDSSNDVTDPSVYNAKAVPEGIYSGYITKSINCSDITPITTYNNNRREEKTYMHDFDLTDLVKGGSLGISSDRYLLIQKKLNEFNNASNPYSQPVQPYLSVYNSGSYPTLTIEYEKEETLQATDATGKGILSQTAGTENFPADGYVNSDTYGYSITFNGEVDAATLTEANVVVKDSEGTVIDLDGTTDAEEEVNCLTYDAETYTLTVPFPKSTSKGGATKWMTAGETYTIILSDDILNTNGEKVFAEDKELTVTMENKPYAFYRQAIRTSTADADSVMKLRVGDVGTNTGDNLVTYVYLSNFTDEPLYLYVMLAIYDEIGNLVQVGARKLADCETSDNIPGYYVQPNDYSGTLYSNAGSAPLVLKQDLETGYVVKSLVWNAATMEALINSAATNDSKYTMNKITVQAAAQ